MEFQKKKFYIRDFKYFTKNNKANESKDQT